MRIESDNGLSELIASAEETKLATGFDFTEGPVWIPDDNCLLFSDIPANTIYRWRPGSDEAEVYLQPSNHSNGLTLDNEGNLLICESGGRRVSMAPYGSTEVEVLAESYEEKRFNSPNDIVVATTGAIYFTDPDYGLLHPDYGSGEDAREIDALAVYRIATNRVVQRMVTDLEKPNGLVLSPNESLMFIADSGANKVNRYTVFADGALASQGELFLDMSGVSATGVADGMKVDSDGRLWTTGPGGVWVVDMDGTEIGRFSIDEQPANLAWGGPDFSTLYITARTSIYSIETNVRGVAPGAQ